MHSFAFISLLLQQHSWIVPQSTGEQHRTLLSHLNKFCSQLHEDLVCPLWLMLLLKVFSARTRMKDKTIIWPVTIETSPTIKNILRLESGIAFMDHWEIWQNQPGHMVWLSTYFSKLYDATNQFCCLIASNIHEEFTLFRVVAPNSHFGLLRTSRSQDFCCIRLWWLQALHFMVRQPAKSSPTRGTRQTMRGYFLPKLQDRNQRSGCQSQFLAWQIDGPDPSQVRIENLSC